MSYWLLDLRSSIVIEIIQEQLIARKCDQQTMILNDRSLSVCVCDIIRGVAENGYTVDRPSTKKKKRN